MTGPRRQRLGDVPRNALATLLEVGEEAGKDSGASGGTCSPSDILILVSETTFRPSVASEK